MATSAGLVRRTAAGGERFFVRGALVMALLVYAGFSFHLAMGRSSFAAPLRVHIHALLFMGWTTLYLLQNLLVGLGRMDLHRRLGWIAAAWLLPLVVSGTFVTVAGVRNGTAPFFFQPVHFLVFNPLSILFAAGLTVAAIILRRRTEWHRRLHFCSMALLLGPAFGRLLPLPLLQPWAWEATFVATALFPLAGAWADGRRSGRIHPAWSWGLAAFALYFLLTQAIAYSPIGIALYETVTAGTPGAAVAPLDFAPPPAGPTLIARP